MLKFWAPVAACDPATVVRPPVLQVAAARSRVHFAFVNCGDCTEVNGRDARRERRPRGYRLALHGAVPRPLRAARAERRQWLMALPLVRADWPAPQRQPVLRELLRMAQSRPVPRRVAAGRHPAGSRSPSSWTAATAPARGSGCGAQRSTKQTKTKLTCANSGSA